MSDYDKALELMRANRDNPPYQKVYDLLCNAHSNNDCRATYALATWYLHGEFVDKDCKKGNELLKIASEQDMASAQFDLAVSYEKGLGTRKNFKKAFELYLRAALNGDKQSIYEVSCCIYFGIGVEKNKNIGDIFFDEAERHGIKEN